MGQRACAKRRDFRGPVVRAIAGSLDRPNDGIAVEGLGRPGPPLREGAVMEVFTNPLRRPDVSEMKQDGSGHKPGSLTLKQCLQSELLARAL